MDELGRRPAKAHRIAVIGGGFTGAAFVIHAARLIPRSLEIDLIEPSAALGRGLAYSAIDPLHRINVPSSRMSLFADRPADATDWLFRNGILPGDGSSTDEAGHHYVSRSDFGAYVASTLEETLTAADGRVRLRRHRTFATGLRRTGDGWSMALSTDGTIEGDRVALCFGHAPPSLPCPVSIEAAADPRFVANPWRADGLSTIELDAAVLLVGTGLTMADVAVSLLSRGHRATITAVSRRGLLARPQGVFADDANFLEGIAAPTTALELLRLVRRRVRASIASAVGIPRSMRCATISRKFGGPCPKSNAAASREDCCRSGMCTVSGSRPPCIRFSNGRSATAGWLSKRPASPRSASKEAHSWPCCAGPAAGSSGGDFKASSYASDRNATRPVFRWLAPYSRRVSRGWTPSGWVSMSMPAAIWSLATGRSI
jgi:hypothetical protein